MRIYHSEIETLNNLPYSIDNESWIKEIDIIKHLCNDNWDFYVKYFMEGTYLNLKRSENQFPLLHTLIAVHEVFELVVEQKVKTETEKTYEMNVWSFIVQLAKIGAKELNGERPPLHVMEEMLKSKTK